MHTLVNIGENYISKLLQLCMKTTFFIRLLVQIQEIVHFRKNFLVGREDSFQKGV